MEEQGFRSDSAERARTQERSHGEASPAGQNAFEKFPRLALWMERLANSRIEGVGLSEWGEFCTAVNSVSAVAIQAQALIREGLRLTPDGLIVRERRDKTDPHYRLCDALDALAKAEDAA